MAFITETDTKSLIQESDYQIQGYKTIFPKKIKETSKVRILAFVKESLANHVILRSDLMSNEFPSIWIEVSNQIQKNTIIGGFYRQWTSETCTKNEAEEQGIAILIAQIEKASSENKTILMLGDANLCSNKWRDLNFLNRKIANQLTETLDANGLICIPVGATFLANQCQMSGEFTESWLDHVYHSEDMITDVITKTIQNSSSDHLPVVAGINMRIHKKVFKRKIRKRKTIWHLFQ